MKWTERAVKSYARGWRDAIAALQAKAPEMPQHGGPDIDHRGNGAVTEAATPQRQRGRPEKAITLVHDAIFAEPGLRGVDIVRALENKVVDRTVRSALRRLKKGRSIWQRNGKWYPKQERADPENENGEALGSPPQ